MKPNKQILEKIVSKLESIEVSGKVSIMVDASGKYVDIVTENRERMIINEQLTNSKK